MIQLLLGIGLAVLTNRRTVLAGAAAIPLLGWLNELNAQTVVRTRPSVYTSAATSHITSLRTAVAAMKALPSTDRRNWIRIADIHRNSCQHRQWWFPFWHRLYVLHFETIVRQQSGSSSFVLPYWDYAPAANRAMPPAFRQPAATSNPLWTSRRAASINGGGTLPASAVSATTAMNTLPYLSNGSIVGFGGPRVASATLRGPGQGALERQPHGPVHTAIGGADGLMSNVPGAAQDPIFWLHHCNIDRLIEDWYRRANGRDYPTDDDAWMDQAFTFTDLLGKQVTGRVRDVLYTPDLGYRYPGITPRQPPTSAAVAARSMATTTPREVPAAQRGSIQGRTLHAHREELVVPLSPAGDLGAGGVTLQFDNVAFLPAGRGVYFEVYVNVPEGIAPNPDSANFVGTISAFGNTEEAGGGEHQGHGAHAMAAHTFDISQAISSTTREATITLVPVSTEPLPHRAIARIGSISILQH